MTHEVGLNAGGLSIAVIFQDMRSGFIAFGFIVVCIVTPTKINIKITRFYKT